MHADYPNIPGYELHEILGTGGFASVYLARQILLDRLVALKVMDPVLARDREFCERFVREARDTAGLGNHASIVTVHDIGRVGDIYYIAMQYLPGPNLKELVDADEPYQHPLHIVRRIADALAYAHARGFVHRDVKPANILFNEANEAVLSDFGIAKSLGRSTQFTTAGAIIGTAKYMSPEQAKGLDTIDHRSDLYSLGVVLFELLTRTPPYRSGDPMTLMLKHINDPVPTLPESEAIYQPLIDRLMAKRPDDRYASGEELLEDMARYMDSGDPTSRGAPLADITGGHRRRPLLIGAAALAAALVGGYAVFDAGFGTDAVPDPSLDSSTLGALDAFTPDAGVLDALTRDAAPPDTAVSDTAVSDTVVPDAAAREAAGLGTTLDTVTPGSASSELASTDAPMSDSEQKRLVRLLDVAELHELVGRISEPPGANALEAYALALEIDPGNALARDALTRLQGH